MEELLLRKFSFISDNFALQVWVLFVENVGSRGCPESLGLLEQPTDTEFCLGDDQKFLYIQILLQ
jgi:hypothetical protein